MDSHGNVAGTPRGRSPRAHGRVTFDDKDENFADVEELKYRTLFPSFLLRKLLIMNGE